MSLEYPNDGKLYVQCPKTNESIFSGIQVQGVTLLQIQELQMDCRSCGGYHGYGMGDFFELPVKDRLFGGLLRKFRGNT